MATSRIFSLTRNLFTAKQTLNSLLFTTKLSSSRSFISLPRSSFPNLRPIAAVGFRRFLPDSASFGGFRSFATKESESSLNDNYPNWSNPTPDEEASLDGCDFEHWLVFTDPPAEGATRHEIIDSYIKILAQVVGSEEEARMKIYSVSTRCYYAFGALVSEEQSNKLNELPNIQWVLPDSYLDIRNKDYGGEPFINGQAVPYDPKYHEDWIRNNRKGKERNSRNDRPRNADRSRNFERQQGNQGGPRGQPKATPNIDATSNHNNNIQPNNAQNTPLNNAEMPSSNCGGPGMPK